MEDRTIKEILQDHLDSFLEEGALHIHREQSIEYISGKGVVITGIRRSGKSTFLETILSRFGGPTYQAIGYQFF
ncbi:MAG: hypothetical protein IPK04_02915 [Bdellovibrionales bacterium]|nr:hypothetical protein [Bdellovibrionales bacterium]